MRGHPRINKDKAEVPGWKHIDGAGGWLDAATVCLFIGWVELMCRSTCPKPS